MSENPARVRLRPFPVLVACEGCPAHGQAARDVGVLLDARGLVETAWLGAARTLPTVSAKVKSRFPVYALDACDKGCARVWLVEQGVTPRASFTLAPDVPAELEADRLAGEL